MELVTSVVLGALFLLAGASKIAAGPSWIDQARGLGVPPVIAAPVPWVEIVLGALLTSQVAPIPAAIVAGTLLIAFTALMLIQMAKGNRPPCACFGGWSAQPIGAWHLVRNVAMLALAVVIIVVA